MEKTWEYPTLMKVITIFVIVVCLNMQTTKANDKLIGYYYPVPNNIENYKARMRVSIDTNRVVRKNIVKVITNEFLNKPYPPRFAIFMKGIRAEKLVIVSMTGGNFDTTYRARALLESMTAVVRRSPLFRDIKPETLLNSLDLFKMLGFKKIVVSDGDKFSYQVVLK